MRRPPPRWWRARGLALQGPSHNGAPRSTLHAPRGTVRGAPPSFPDEPAALKVIQIRNVPDDVHRTLRTRAAAADMTLSDLALEELTAAVMRSPVAEVLRRAEARGEGTVMANVVAAVRATRETA